MRLNPTPPPRRSSQSLKAARDWYRRCAAMPGVSVQDRDLWTQLADELDHRLGQDGEEEDAPLW